MSKLNAKQIRFCEEYIIDLNATQASIRAGYSERTAAVIGHENMNRPEIKTRIEALQADLRERNKVKADDVIQELKALAFWSINDFIEEGNTIVDISQLDRKVTKPVVGVKTKTETRTIGDIDVVEKTVELKFADKRGALVDLGRHLGIFKEDNEQKTIKIKVSRK